MKRKAVFLDRDGTINEDFGYVCKPKDWRWLPHALEGIAAFNAAGWKVVVASNQSGIARGFYGLGDLHVLENFIEEQLAARGVAVDAWKYCPHLPEITGHCLCRKPAPGMLLEAAREMDIDLRASWMLGDRTRDVRAGLAAGCHAGLISANPNSDEVKACKELYPAVPVWTDLLRAANAILG